MQKSTFSSVLEGNNCKHFTFAANCINYTPTVKVYKKIRKRIIRFLEKPVVIDGFNIPMHPLRIKM